MKIVVTKDKRLLFYCVLFAAVGVLVFTGIYFGYRRKLAQYTAVRATVEGVQTEYGKSEETMLTRQYYMSYSYTYEGREYVSRRQMLGPYGNPVGTQETILIDPKHPEKIEDILLQRVLLFGMAVCTLLVLLGFRGAAGYLMKK